MPCILGMRDCFFKKTTSQIMQGYSKSMLIAECEKMLHSVSTIDTSTRLILRIIAVQKVPITI